MLEPEIAAFVEKASAIYPSHSTPLTPPEQRALYDRYALSLTPPLPAGIEVEDGELQSRAGHAIRLRLYRSRAVRRDAAVRGTVLFFHGGGFVLGSLDSHQHITARIAADTGLDVIAVDYRLAPEHRAPAAHDDCLDVTRAALERRLPFASLELDSLQLVGDSAGATLAASVALRLRDERAEQRVHGLVLVYPMLGTEPQPPARDTEAHAPMLTAADVRRFRDLYWGDGSDGTPYPAWTIPLNATRFDALAPTLALAAEHDPLRDDARVYVERMRAAAGDARLWIGTGLVHGCWRALDSSPGVQRMHDTACAFLRERAEARTG
ncbi:alpha/beta hydrolase [Paraburkholderia sp. PREW-6R]|uniref:alpha/beta hydrolase n=1 Tax=Paraburkholderia sp. PREW-6R TaxID=3141544 RepID=UPI0031F5837E